MGFAGQIAADGLQSMAVSRIGVTVVVTGLGAHRDASGISGVANNAASIRPVRNTRVDGSVDYHQLERPTYLRNQDSTKPQVQQPVAELDREKEMEYLDIPAFLRKQED